jgi:hypothetical protein
MVCDVKILDWPGQTLILQFLRGHLILDDLILFQDPITRNHQNVFVHRMKIDLFNIDLVEVLLAEQSTCLGSAT